MISKFLLIFAFLLIQIKATPPKIVSAEYELKDLNLFGNILTVAEVTVTTDQDIYTAIPTTCSVGACNPNITTCACDYSDPKNCGIPPTDNCTCNFVERECGGNFTQLLPNQPILINSNSLTTFRYYHSDHCAAFRIRYQSYGDLRYMTLRAIETGGMETSLSKTQLEICPNNQLYPMNITGTYEIQFVGTTSVPYGWLTVESYIPKLSKTNTPCDAGPLCMYDSIKVAGFCYRNANTSYQFVTPNCSLFALRVSPRTALTKFVAHAYWTNSIGNYSVSSYESSVIGDNLGIFSQCTDGINNTLEIRVDCGVDGSGPFALGIFSVDDTWDLIPLANMSIWDATWYLLNSAQFSVGNSSYTCSSYDSGCSDFFPTHPVYAQPFLPIISKILQGKIFSYLEIKAIYSQLTPSIDIQYDYMRLYPQVSKRQLKYFLVVDAQTSDAPVKFHDPDTLNNFTVSIIGGVANAAGEPLVGQTTIQPVSTTAHCDYSTFQLVNEIFNDTINQLESINIVATTSQLTPALRYAALQFSQPVRKCRQALLSFYDVYETSSTVSQQYCPYDDNDQRALNDSCCSRAMTWSNGCPFRDTYTTSNTYALKSNTNDLLATCGSPVCTASFLSDYQATLNGQPCPKTIVAIDSHSKSLISTMRDCKASIFGTAKHGMGGTSCFTDSDCEAGLCDPRYHTCISRGKAQQELDYIKCLFTSSAVGEKETSALLSLISYSVNETAPTDPDLLYPWLRDNVFSDTSCIKSYDIPGFYWNWDSCIAPYGTLLTIFDTNLLASCPASAVQFIDLSDTNVLDTGWNSCTSDYEPLWELYSEAMHPVCGNKVVCNWNSTCTNASCCDVSNSSCMLCHDPLNCHSFSQIKDPGLCNISMGCITYQPNPDIYPLNYGFGTPAPCVSACSQYCYNPVCTGAVGCANLTLLQCQNCKYGGGGCPGQCSLNITTPCATKDACQNSGICSSSDFLMDLTTGRWGGCMFPRQAPISELVINACPANGLTGQGFMQMVGTECFDPSSTSPKSCSTKGGTWRFPATSKESCELNGCYEPLPDKTYGLLYTFGYSNKNQSECVGEDRSWQPIYTWTQASWVDPISRRLSWTKHAVLPVDEVGPRIQFNPKVYKTMVDMSLGASIGSTTSSAALCDFSSTKAVLETVTCDCYGGNGDCFQNNLLVPLVVGDSCGGDVTVIEGAYFYLNFSSTAVKQSKCVTVTGSELSASWFRKEQLSLTSSFAEFKQPISYPAYNDNGKEIGALLSDGVSVTFSDMSLVQSSYLICIKTNTDGLDLSFYDVYDLGKTTGDSSQVQVMQVKDVYLNGTYVCGHVKPVTNDEVYFVVMRISDVNGSIQYFDFSTLVQLYILASLFVVCTIYGAAILIIVTYQVVKKTQPFKLQFFIIMGCLFGFNAIRCIYFFMVPNGIYSPVSDYVLVAFPTFLYFTAFSQIVVIWFVLTSVDMMKVRVGVTSIINKITIVVNILIYAVFLAVVLAFHFENGGSAITCGTKYISTPNSSVKQITTVVYAVVIAFFSFLLCLTLGIFGFKFVWQQYQRSKNIGVTSGKAKNKVFKVAVVGGIAFFLHSGYILIQTALYQPKIIFNFIAIFVTEIIPSLYMYYNQFTFNQSQKKEHQQLSSGSANTRDSHSNFSERSTFSHIEMSQSYKSS